MAMRKLNKLGCAVVLFVFAFPALAADVAVLRNGFSIRHERRETLGAVTRLYLDSGNNGYVDIVTNQIERFETDPSLSPPASASPQLVTPGRQLTLAPPAQPQSLAGLINSAGDQHHIDPDLIESVIHAESGFNPRAISPKGARGLMQLMPQTASRLGVSNSFDPRANVEGGTRYLSELLRRYDFDLIKALAAYNAGPERVEQYRGVPPYYETRAYVARIVRDFNRKKLAQRKAAAATAKAARNPASPPPGRDKQATLQPSRAAR